jgi:ABC-type antimicrobial peptide transport system permease subunit
MNAWRYVTRSLLHHWRINCAVALGVAAATAVLTGALLIGDAMRGSLRTLTLDRLGRIDEILVVDRFFRVELASELAASPGFGDHYEQCVAAILFPQASIEATREAQQTARAGNVLVMGVPEDFWQLDISGNTSPAALELEQVILNQPLAEELGVGVGDLVTLRLPQQQDISPDSPLGDRDDAVRSIPRLEVVEVIPARGLGRFDLRASQSLPRNAYVSLATLQEELRQDGLANALLVSGKDPSTPPDFEASKQLARMLKPTIEDLGLLITPVELSWLAKEPDQTVVLSYFSLSSTRMMLEDDVITVAHKAFEKHTQQGVLTYLANAIYKVSAEQPAADGEGQVPEPREVVIVKSEVDNKKKSAAARLAGDKLVPYSLVASVDSIPTLGPLLDDDGQLLSAPGNDEIILTSWMADDMQAAVGDWIRLEYFDPETTHGKNVEMFVDLQVKAVVRLEQPQMPYGRRAKAIFSRPPTLANDPNLTPEVPGVTDQRSINDWDLPFPLVHRIRGPDDDFWNYHRTTPKAYVSLPVGQRLWGSRFGQLTSLRIVPESHDVTRPAEDGQAWDSGRLGKELVQTAGQMDLALGFEFLAIKREGLEASRGATPFDMLFLALSLFVIAAALMLVSLLFQLGMQQRCAETGTLIAIGIPGRKIVRMLVAENLLVSVVGSLLGVAAGIGYALLMLAGLRSWWVGAISTPFLEFHWTGRTLLLGALLGTLISIITITWSVWRSRGVPVRQLLSGRTGELQTATPGRQPRWLSVATSLCFLVGVGLAVLAAVPSIAAGMGSEGQAGAFVGSGAAILAGLLLVIRSRFRQQGSGRSLTDPPVLFRLAIRNASRNPQRSTMTIGLMATASFLVLSMGAFRLDVVDTGTGGFDGIATSSIPIFGDLSTPGGRKDVLVDDLYVQRLEGTTILQLRLKPGDDASCNNMYQASQPQVLGVTSSMVEHFDDPEQTSFQWAGSEANDAQGQNPWQLLDSRSMPHGGTDNDPVPVVIDKNTAMFSLKLMGGVGQVFPITYDNDQVIHFRITGMLANSVLQGNLLISESDFQHHFPTISGYRYFLIQSAPGQGEQVQAVLEDRLNDQGFDVQSASKRLESLLAVQNTYLSTFQSLGALGMLLGTFGLATVQLRNVLERRSELALLRSSGFSARRLATMILLENMLLLLGGLATGGLAALCAVLPHVVFGGASAPGMDLAVMLAIVLAVGLVSGLVAVRATLRAPILPALRGD